MGLTQAQMAGLLRVPLVTVRAWERGRSPILRPVRVKCPRFPSGELEVNRWC
jgi:hypothetical protein